MPKILTSGYKNKTFVLPFTDDKSECAYIKPLSDTEIRNIQLKAATEGGADEQLAAKYFTRIFLQEAITGWKGFFDVAGNEIPHSIEAIKDICECDPEFAAIMVLRIRSIARMGELEERKN